MHIQRRLHLRLRPRIELIHKHDPHHMYLGCRYTSLQLIDPELFRAIGKYAEQKFHAQTGEPLDDRAYEEHLKEYTPSAADKQLLLDIIGSEKKWIAEKVGARDPLASIGEVRKSAINL